MDRETPNVILVNRLIRIGLVLALVAAAIVAIGIVDRKKQEQMLQKKVESERVLPVRIVKPESGNPDEDLVLPGNVMPFYEAPIYARVNGYLKAWYTDYGAHVRKGDLLGVIETPELDEEIQKGEADLATAEVNWELAEVTSKRWQNLLPSNSVSKQEVDEKMGDAKAKAAIVQSVRSNLETLKTRRSFNQLIAPFDGVVTDRRTDIGQLINAGFGTGQELFKVADIKKLRIYVDVPQRFAGEIRKGMTAELSFPGRPKERFQARLVTTANAVDRVSRTLKAEFLLDNQGEENIPGSYADVHLNLAKANEEHLRIPSSALIFREGGTKVAVATDGNKVRLKKIVIGRDFGQTIEVESGVSPADRVIDMPSDSIQEGDEIRIVEGPGGAEKEVSNQNRLGSRE